MAREPPSGDAPITVEPGQLTALLRAIAELPEDPGALAEGPDLDVVGFVPGMPWCTTLNGLRKHVCPAGDSPSDLVRGVGLLRP